MSQAKEDHHPLAIVTGAGSGIGRAISRRLNRAGYRMALAGRRLQALETTLSEFAHDYGSFAVPTDVSDPRSVDALFDVVADRAGRVDVLVNNAGIAGEAAAIDDYSLDEWDKAIATNLTGAFLCARRAFRQMVQQHPSGGTYHQQRVALSKVARPGAVAYTASKHGITGLTKALALEGRSHQIACGQIHIGNATTEMANGVAAGALQADGSILAEPTISAEHVAEAVLYMVTLPLEANVLSMTVMATGMPFAGRG